MKITIAPSRPHKGAANMQYATVSIEHSHDDLVFGEVVELFKHAALAYGFAPATVSEFFDHD